MRPGAAPITGGSASTVPGDHVRPAPARLLRADPGRPLVTFYDDATGERTELSVTTYANWVAKAASLLAEELDLERGRPAARRPARRTGSAPVFLGAAWTVGPRVVSGPDDADAVVCGPGRAGALGGRAGGCPCWRARCCRWAGGSPTPLPDGVHDFGRRGLVAARRVHAPGPARPTTTSALPGQSPSRAVERGRRREPCSPTAAASSRRRTRLPHPGLASFIGAARRAARWSWSPTPTRGVSRRRTPPSAPRRASLERGQESRRSPGQVVAAHAPRRGTGGPGSPWRVPGSSHR